MKIRCFASKLPQWVRSCLPPINLPWRQRLRWRQIFQALAAPQGPNNQTQPVTKVVAPPPPPPPPKPPAPIEQVAVQIKKAIGEGADKINIKLQPANLGKVEVRMEIGKDGVLTANVIAEKPETLELLQRDVRGLEKVLQEGGLKTDTQSFNFSLKEQAQQQAANRREETERGARQQRSKF